MDFFGDYTIETASCHPSSLPPAEEDVFAPSTFPPPSPISPRDTTTSYPSTIVNITDLTRHFTLQTLDVSGGADDGLASPTSLQHLQVPPSPRRRSSITSSRSTPCWKRRMQRQSQVRMLADPIHLRSISELVERMVDSNDQCGVTRRTLPDLLPTPATPMIEHDDFDSSDSGSPRSLSSSSSNGRRPSYFTVEVASPTRIRASEGGSLAAAMKDCRIQKKRASRGARR